MEPNTKPFASEISVSCYAWASVRMHVVSGLIGWAYVTSYCMGERGGEDFVKKKKKM